MQTPKKDCKQQSHGKSNSSETTTDDIARKVEKLTAEDTNQLLRTVLSEVGGSLESMSPDEGVERYLQSRTGISSNTKEDYQRKLQYFLEYCQLSEIENLNNLSGRDLSEYKTWRREESTDEVDTLAPTTMEDDLILLRHFIGYLESIEAVEPNLSEKVTIPESDEMSRDIELEPERLKEILDYQSKYKYATLDHVTVALIGDTGRRLGAIRGLDITDYNQDDSDPYLKIRHRPGETRLKNGYDGEAEVSLSPPTHEILSSYIETNRHEVEDEHGRRPLLTTKHGRPAHSTLRRIVYKYTRPCYIGNPCPHGKSPDDCEAAENRDSASKCESSRSPHAMRHGYLTELLRHGIPKEVITDRCDLTVETLEKHYDERSEEEKRRYRKEVLEGNQQNGGGYL